MSGAVCMAKYPGRCAGCDNDIFVGEKIEYYGQGEAYHFDCRPRTSGLAQDFKDLKQDGFLFTDLETGGLDATKHPILQIAAIATTCNFRLQGYFMTYVKPRSDMEITEEALKITGIKLKDIESAPSEVEAIRAFAEFASMKSNIRFSGFNCPFDQGFLDQTLKRNGLNGTSLYLVPAFDVFQEAKKKLNLESYKLVNVCKHFGISINAHDAMADIYATIKVARRLVN